MRKALSEREQNTIKAKLIESCRVCWERYGYKKTGVAEIASMSGISTGAFYTFFPSKEMLFMETANAFIKKLYELMATYKPNEPTKYDFALGFKKCTDEMFENKWIFSLREDAKTFLRKLPEDFLEQDFKQDLLDITAVVNLYELMAACKPQSPTTYDFAVGFKKCTDEMFENKWIFSLREDAQTFLRKLPEDFLEQDFKQDLLDITAVVDMYRLTPKVSMEEIVAVFHTLLMSIYLTEIIGISHKQALNLLIDSVIVDLFE